MKKKYAVLAAFLAWGCTALAGCGQKTASGGWNTGENSIYVTKDMAVQSAMVYTSEKSNDLYTKDGLEAYAREAVSVYNAEQGAAAESENQKNAERLPAALKSCELNGQTGTLVLEYGSAEDFVKFAQMTGDNTHTVTELNVGTVADMTSDLPDVSFLTAAGKEAELSAVTGAGDSRAVIAEGAGTIYVDGQLTYVTEGVTVKAGNAVMTPEGASCIIFK